MWRGGAILYELKAHSYCNSTIHSTVLYFFCILPINSTAILLSVPQQFYCFY